MRVDGSRIRKEKVSDSKISGYVWTGPEFQVANLVSTKDEEENSFKIYYRSRYNQKMYLDAGKHLNIIFAAGCVIRRGFSNLLPINFDRS